MTRWGNDRRRLRRVCVAAALTTGALALAFSPAAALASGNVWAPGIQATLPTTAGASSGASIGALSCASAGNCTAVGSYDDSSSHAQGLLLTETAGTWARGVEATLPVDAGSNPEAQLGSVSCSSAGNCTAVGSYADGALNIHGLLITETAGAWGPGVEASLPTNAGSNPGVQIASVACTAPGTCTAVGSYADGLENVYGVILTETAGAWATGFEPSLPSAWTAPDVHLTSVSCPSNGDCTALGSYLDSFEHEQALLLTESSDAWATGVEAQIPAGGALPTLNAVSCGSAGNCTAVGFYFDSTNVLRGLLLTETSDSWVAGVPAPLPPGSAPSSRSILLSVSCVSAGNCATAGAYDDGVGDQQGLMLTQSASAWTPAVEASLPGDAAANPLVLLNSVSCASAGNCSAVGSYVDGSGTGDGLLLMEASGIWGPGIAAQLPTPGGQSTTLNAVSCSSADNCTAVGSNIDSSGVARGLLVSTLAVPTLALSAPGQAQPGTTIAPSLLSDVLSSGSAPSGTLTFTVFGPQSSAPTSCTSGGTPVGIANVSGNGTYHPSAGFTPKKPGNYWWYASYGGDASNDPAASVCGASMAETVVAKAKNPKH